MATLPTDDNGVPTSAEYANPASPSPGGQEWVQWGISADGGHITLGAKADSAETSSAATGTGMAFLKGVVSLLTSILAKLTAGAASMVHLEDAAAADGDGGVGLLGVRRDSSGTQVGADGDYEQVQLVGGRVRVITQDEEANDGSSNSTSTALEDDRIVKASAGVLHGFQGHVSSTGSDGFIQVFDAATATGTPVQIIPIQAGKAFSMSYVGDRGRGRTFATGIVIAFSSTETTYTSGGDYMWVDAQYD